MARVRGTRKHQSGNQSAFFNDGKRASREIPRGYGVQYEFPKQGLPSS